jgi:hypothetical protein
MPADDTHCTQCTLHNLICDYFLNPCVLAGDKTYEGALATHYAAETGKYLMGKLSKKVVFVFALFYAIFLLKRVYSI